MFDYEFVSNPRQVRTFATEFVREDPRATPFDTFFRAMYENMMPSGDQKLLVSRSDGVTWGFIKYSALPPESVESISQSTKIFSLGGITDYKGNTISREDISNYKVFSLYTGEGSLVFIDHIEVARLHKRRSVATGLLDKVIEVENVELMEGLAHPKSINFWLAAGFSFQGLRSEELAVIGRHKNGDNTVSKSNWGFYFSSNHESGKSSVRFFGPDDEFGWGTPYASYSFIFSDDGTSTFSASRAVMGIDELVSDIGYTSIQLTQPELLAITNPMVERVTPEREFEKKLSHRRI